MPVWSKWDFAALACKYIKAYAADHIEQFFMTKFSSRWKFRLKSPFPHNFNRNKLPATIRNEKQNMFNEEPCDILICSEMKLGFTLI